MTDLLDRALKELKKRSHREQDDVARDILARIGSAAAAPSEPVIGQSKTILHLVDPNDALVDVLTDADVAEWYSDKLAAP